MNKKIKSFLLYSSVAVISSASVGVGTYFIIKKLQQVVSPKVKEIENNWENVPLNFKEFSQNNSFQVQFQIYPGVYTFGTAWSWYYKKVSQYSYDWYLMTNFHVVNEAVAYENNLITLLNDKVEITDTSLLLDYYSSNISTTYNKNFILKKYNGYEYKTILSSYNKFYTNGLESVSIITDFDNNNVNLFSESQNGVSKYNLDMALIKLSLSFNDDKHLKYQCPNVWELYENLDQISKNNFDSNSDLEENNTYIAGNPYKYNQLVGVLLSKNEWKKTTLSSNLGGEGEEYAVLKNLKAPYFYSYDSYRNFLLTGGASGSAIYLVDLNNDLDLNQIIPNGIYWGGKENRVTQDFTPSYIPFVVRNVYNIFDNFKQYINN